MAEAMLHESVILNVDYLVLIFQFFNIILSDFYGPLIERLDIAQLGNIVLNE